MTPLDLVPKPTLSHSMWSALWDSIFSVGHTLTTSIIKWGAVPHRTFISPELVFRKKGGAGCSRLPAFLQVLPLQFPRLALISRYSLGVKRAGASGRGFRVLAGAGSSGSGEAAVLELSRPQHALPVNATASCYMPGPTPRGRYCLFLFFIKIKSVEQNSPLKPFKSVQRSGF